MKQIFLLLILFLSIVYTACKSTPGQTPAIAVRDTTLNAAVSYSDLFIDSMAMERFIVGHQFTDSLDNRIRSFYNRRNYQAAWFFKEGIADCANTFYEMYNDYISYSGDSSLYNQQLQQLYDTAVAGNFKATDTTTATLELLLTAQFFRYAATAYQGSSKLDAKELEWFIPRKKIDAVALLDSLLANKGKNLSAYEPVNRQYNLLKEQLLKYYQVEKKGGWPVITAAKKSYKLNDSATVLITIKRNLYLMQDMDTEDTSVLFTPALQAAVKVFEKRYGFKEDGIINPALIKEMNRPVKERLQQILVNMERLRWIPAQPSTDYLFINIPDYRLHVYENGNYAFNMNVVTGSVIHNTVIFSGALKYVVFSPYWNVPTSIIKKEILPGMAKNKNYLAKHNMEWNNGAVRQKPGLSNSLGLVKFLFPNSYNIYLHDSPAKSLFNESKRAFSHGCIRLAEPKKLAQFLLRNDTVWNDTKITSAMNAGKEKYVTLKEPIPVFIGYFTAWVDRDGKLNFRDDIYGHDEKLAARLFKK